jgi:hypothetical protein
MGVHLANVYEINVATEKEPCNGGRKEAAQVLDSTGFCLCA